MHNEEICNSLPNFIRMVKIEEDEISMVCSMNGRDEKWTQNSVHYN
jgi:hypothetical protein